MPSCDVLIVGAGPSGLVLAGLLAQAGVDVVVVERRSRPRQYSRAIGLHPPALDVLGLVGVEESARTEGLKVRAGIARSRGRTLGELSFERAWPERPYVLTLPQNRTEALLQERLEQLAPGALHLGWTITDYHQDAEGVFATASPTDHPAATTTTWRARFIVGADGPRSLVRNRAGIDIRSRTLTDTYLMGDFPMRPSTQDSVASDLAVIYLEPAGVVESFPLPGRSRRWVAHTGTQLAEASPVELARLVQARTGEKLDPDVATMISAFRVYRRLATRLVHRRQVLIGDAAHEISPIGGQGMTLGLLDAAHLAPILIRALTTGTVRLEQKDEFRSFERHRIASALKAARQAEFNMMMGRPMSASGLRNGVVRALLTSPTRHTLARAFTMRSLGTVFR